MDALTTLIERSGFAGLTWQNLVMYALGGLLIYLAIRKNYEPLLLIPIGFGRRGARVANTPCSRSSRNGVTISLAASARSKT